MRKNRNSFFENNLQGFNPPPMGFMANNTSSFIAGNMNSQNDIEERLAKIERNISRLENRISKLETASIKSTEDFESTTNNMYIL